MYKKIISILAVLFTIGSMLICLAGCDSDNDNSSIKESALHKISFVDLKYDEVKNFSRKEKTLDLENNKTYNYFFAEDTDKNIKLIWYKGKDESVVIDSSDKYEERGVNGVNWKVIRNTDFGATYDTYSTVHNGDLYVIELNGVDKYQTEFDEFINSVEF